MPFRFAYLGVGESAVEVRLHHLFALVARVIDHGATALSARFFFKIRLPR
jgi:hypothetical protein